MKLLMLFTMLSINNKAIVQRLYDQAMNQRQFSLLEQIISPDYQNAQGQTGVNAYRPFIDQLLVAFPDAHWDVNSMIAEDDKVFVRQTFTGTHTGTFQQVAPTGRKVATTGMIIYTLKEGRIIHSEVLTDRVGFLQTLGVLPQQLTRTKTEVTFVDRFIVPPAAEKEFLERVHVNRTFIHQLPGFIEDAAYRHTDDQGNLIFLTTARWESQAALNGAKVAVQAEYKQQGFDMPAMLKRLQIQITREVFMND